MTSPATIRQTTFAIGLLFCGAVAARAQGGRGSGPSAGRIDSVPLHAGHRAVVIYDPAVSGALFTLHDSVRANIWVGYADSVAPAMWRCCITTAMRRVGSVFATSITVPAGAASVSARFMAGRLDDPRASTSAMVFDAAGTPVRGAYLRGRGGGLTFAERIQRELAAFPDEYAVYADKWTYVIARADRDSVVRADLRRLAPLAAVPRPPDGLLYALEYGSMIVADEPGGRTAIKRMAALYPRSERTGDAVLDYQRRVYASQLTGDGPDEIEVIKWELIRKDPGSSLAELVLSENASDPKIPQATFEPVARLWIRGKLDDPRGHLYLAEVLDAHGARSAAAARAEADSALMLLFRPHPPLPRDVKSYLAAAYQVAASLAFRAGLLPVALADIRAMQTFEIEPSPDPYLFDAGIWSRIGNTPQAERSWVVAWQRGSAVADDSLKALYRRGHTSLDGYPAYVAAKSDSVASLGGSRPIAPEVRMVSLQGDTLNARTLAGKVVVLNFWYIGCIPCRVEMPSLNKLVADYKDRDVTFIAVAWDDPDALKAFLSKSAFAYQVVPNGKAIASDFGASLYPTHLVIGKDGRADLRLVGEDSTHVPLLRLLIDRALARK